MSRSYRKTPIVGYTTAESDKVGKQKANRAFRKLSNSKLSQTDADYEPINEPPCCIRQVSSVWSFPKDGKGWFTINSRTKRYMRK